MTDTERVEWLQRQDFDNLYFGVLQDQPGDGNYCVWVDGKTYEGKTFRDAIDAAMQED